MIFEVYQCVFVVSFPRSGTHLLIDFIRRNFPAFNPKLMFWESASKLYFRLDGPDWQQDARALLRAQRSHVLLQSHRAGYTTQRDVDVTKILNPKSVIFLYPFRKFSRVVKSFAELRRFQSPISQILTSQDSLFGKEASVADCIRAHAESWLKRDANFIDCDLLSHDPETACARLGELLGQTPVGIAQRLPRRRFFTGKPGEIMERLLGRQSTEVAVRYKLRWQSRDEEVCIDNQFHDLYSELSRRRIN